MWASLHYLRVCCRNGGDGAAAGAFVNGCRWYYYYYYGDDHTFCEVNDRGGGGAWCDGEVDV